MLQFLLHYEKTRWKLILGLIIVGFTAFTFLFQGGVTPSYAQDGTERLLSTFGDGKIVVRLYTDYFCGPCKAMEPHLEPILKDLVTANVVRITFIDTPFFKHSVLYARYFLYALNGNKRTIEYAFLVRNALIEASNKKIDSGDRLEAHLESKGIKVKKFDPNPIFEVFTRCIREDKINATPTCVVIRDEKKDAYVGEKDITDALKALIKR